MNNFLPTKYYLRALDPKHALLVQGKVFLCEQSPWDWLSTVTKSPKVREAFVVEPVEEIYFASKDNLRYQHERS